jgi:hypothetical protein
MPKKCRSWNSVFMPKINDYMSKVKSRAVEVETRTFENNKEDHLAARPVQAIFICIYIYIAARSE